MCPFSQSHPCVLPVSRRSSELTKGRTHSTAENLSITPDLRCAFDPLRGLYTQYRYILTQTLAA